MFLDAGGTASLLEDRPQLHSAVFGTEVSTFVNSLFTIVVTKIGSQSACGRGERWRSSRQSFHGCRLSPRVGSEVNHVMIFTFGSSSTKARLSPSSILPLTPGSLPNSSSS